MTGEKYIALDLVSRLAHHFGPTSRVAQEVPGWIEYLTNVECPERPGNLPGAEWWSNVRTVLTTLGQKADGGERDVVQMNAALLGQHFGLDPIQSRVLAFFAFFQIFGMFEHVVDQSLRAQEVPAAFERSDRLTSRKAGSDAPFQHVSISHQQKPKASAHI